MYCKIVSFICCLLFSAAGSCQQAPTPKSSLAKPIKTNEANNQKIYINPDKGPEMTGGLDAWKHYLAQSLDTTIPIKNNAPSGKYIVVIRSIVSYFGIISDVRAETKHGYGMEEEAKRVVQKYPRWEPAIKAGRPVNAFMRQEITFVVPAR
ncbi:MAG: energy transducer TonB [Ferruginibacter sp.]